MFDNYVLCLAKCCPPVDDVKNGNVSAKDSRFGDRIVLHCHEGYAVTGLNVTLCNSNKTWIPPLGVSASIGSLNGKYNELIIMQRDSLTYV